MTLKEVIAKRKESWEKRHDLQYDSQLSESAVTYVLKDEKLRREIIAKPYLLIEIVFVIVNKEKDTVPFFLNEVQKEFIDIFEKEGTLKPFYVLKGRQQGFTSLITAMQLCYAIVKKNFSGFTVADCADNTNAIFNDKAKVVYNRLPDMLKPHEKYNNKKEFFFDKLNSSWRIATATNNMGRSRTLEFLHMSEIAFYDCELSTLQKGIGEALVNGAIVIYETTANGYNEAKDLWDKGSCNNLFFAWWKTKEYSREDTKVIDEAKGEWITARIKWLRQIGVEDKQIAWYVNKFNSYLDNDTIKQEYPCSAEEAFISSGKSEFDKETVIARIEAVKANKPIKRGYYTYEKTATDIDTREIKKIEWVEDSNGMITIQEEPQKKIDIRGEVTGLCPYAIGGDTAGEGSDYFTAKVINNITGVCAATLRVESIDDDLYADQLYCLGKEYNEAIIGIEVNYSREPVRELERLGYTNQYKRERLDTLTNKVENRFGFQTTGTSKPVIISNLKKLFREQPEIETDLNTLYEMLYFVKNSRGSGEAMAGKHDDLVMASAISHFIGLQGEHSWIEYVGEKTSWIADNFGISSSSGGAYIEWD